MKINCIVSGVNNKINYDRANQKNTPYKPEYNRSNITNYILKPTVSNISFGMRVNHGTPAKLAEPLQNKILNIHKNIDFIQNFFSRFTVKNPQLGAKIKKEYHDLIPKRQSGIVFKLPDTKNTIEVMRSQTRDNILYISIDNGSPEYNGIIVDGKDKLIANYLSRHPHMLPQKIRHMSAERIKETEPEKFINLADDKLQNYSDYIRKVESGEIIVTLAKTEKFAKKGVQQKPYGKALPAKKKTVVVSQSETEAGVKKETKNKVKEQKEKVTKFVDRKSEPKTKKVKPPEKLSNADFEAYMTEKCTTIVKDISKLLNGEAKDFPPHITPKLAPSGKALGFTLTTNDGGTLKVTKKAVGSYGNSMPYLSFEKSNPDKSFNFISIDMITNRVLRTKDKGKPHISADHIVYELSADEMKRRKTNDKLDYYMEQIFKSGVNGVNGKEVPPVKETVKEIEQPINKVIQKPDKVKEEKVVEQPTKPTNINPFGKDLDTLKTSMAELGKRDGKIAATEYFNAFKEQFLADLKEKMDDFNNKISELMKNI